MAYRGGRWRATLALVAAIGLLAGCAQEAGPVVISGAALSPGALQALPSQTQTLTFDSKAGPQRHTYVGPRLSDVIESAGALRDPADEHARLATVVVAVGADGFTAAVTWGEIAPELAESPVLLAHTEDGENLDRPRLVVPGDIKGGRYVSDITELRLVDLRSPTHALPAGTRHA